MFKLTCTCRRTRTFTWTLRFTRTCKKGEVAIVGEVELIFV
jgi:hypothetical protein